MDLFSQSLQIRLNSKSMLQTRVGLVMSIIVIGLTIAYAIFAIVQIGDKSNGIITTSEFSAEYLTLKNMNVQAPQDP